MSRPSRGFSVANTRPPSGPTCPATVLCSIEIFGAYDWIVHFTWTPAVSYLTCTTQYQVNGGAWTNYNSDGPFAGGFNIELDPHDLADNGDTLGFRAVLTDGDHCPDLTSNAASDIVTS